MEVLEKAPSQQQTPQAQVCVFALVQKNVTMRNQLQTADTLICLILPHLPATPSSCVCGPFHLFSSFLPTCTPARALTLLVLPL